MFKFFLLIFFVIFYAEALIVSDLSSVVSLAPSEEKEITIQLTNDKDTPELVEFKLSDYSTNHEGETHFLPPGTTPRSNASWITLNEERMKLAPKEKGELHIALKAPSEPSLEGSYFTVLLIEPTDFIQSMEDVKSGIQLNVKVRFAYHIVTNVSEGQAKLKILDKKLTTLAEKKYLEVDVSNLGTLFLNPKLTVKLYSQQGKLAKTLEGQPERLYPGSSQRYLLEAEGLEKGKYKAFLVLDNGDKHLFGDKFEIEF